MSFSRYFAQKIGFGNTERHQLSNTIIRIGQFAVALGIIVALVTLSTGIGARKEIKQKLADFNGHFTVKPYSSNLSYNSDATEINNDFYPNFPLEEVEHIQAIAVKNGVIRTSESFDGVLFKGVDEHFDYERFKKFLRKGSIPKFSENKISEEVIISQKTADNFYLDIDSSFVMIFVNESTPNPKPIYRKFTISGIYSTDIKEFDDLYMIGDIKQLQRINQWNDKQIGGFEIFIKDIEADIFPIQEKINETIGYNLIAESAFDHFADIEEWINIFDTNIFIILFIMVIVVVINIVMILLILILERTKTIGLLKTLGANNNQVRKIFVYYALFIMVPGLVLGNIIALLLLFIQHQYGIIQLPPENYFISKAPVFLSWEMVLGVNLGSILISAITLWIPSLLISRISPVKAMKIN